MSKIKIPKKLFNEILAEIIIEEGHYADPIPKKKLKEAMGAGDTPIPTDRGTQPLPNPNNDEENVPISDQEELALKSRAIKEGIMDWFKAFKINEDTIMLKHGNKAIISDGTGDSYYVVFKVASWNPPSVKIKEMKIVDISDFGDLPQEL